MIDVNKPAERVSLVLQYSFVPGGGFRPQDPWLSRTILHARGATCQL